MGDISPAGTHTRIGAYAGGAAECFAAGLSRVTLFRHSSAAGALVLPSACTRRNGRTFGLRSPWPVLDDDKRIDLLRLRNIRCTLDNNYPDTNAVAKKFATPGQVDAFSSVFRVLSTNNCANWAAKRRRESSEEDGGRRYAATGASVKSHTP